MMCGHCQLKYENNTGQLDVSSTSKMKRSSPSVPPVPDNQNDTRMSPGGVSHVDTRPPHSDYITQLLIDRNYTPIFHMLDDYYEDHNEVSYEVLVRRIMLVTEAPQGMDDMINVFGDLPEEERKKAELGAQITAFLVLGGMGFRTELGLSEDAADEFTMAMVDNLPTRPSTNDARFRRMAERRLASMARLQHGGLQSNAADENEAAGNAAVLPHRMTSHPFHCHRSFDCFYGAGAQPHKRKSEHLHAEVCSSTQSGSS